MPDARPDRSTVGGAVAAARPRAGLGERSRRLLTTTAAGVEWVLVGAFLGFRVLNVVQALISLPMVGRDDSRGAVDGAALALLLVEIVVVALVVSRRGRYDDPRLATLDIAFNIAVLASTALFTQGGDRFDTWADWGYPVTLSAALGAGIAFPRLARRSPRPCCSR